MLYKVLLTYEPVEYFLTCDHLNESCSFLWCCLLCLTAWFKSLECFRNKRYLSLSFFGGDMRGGKGRKDVAEEGKALLSLTRWIFSLTICS